ncbi:MAG: M15 family metallopeptidase [Defluviitaleaceae bacterium]|nr:M15 family metallopeptidase [Defluviitaleaceae bacterium]
MIFKRESLPEHIKEFIKGVSFKEDTPFGYEELTYLTISYVDFGDNNCLGDMIVATKIGDEVLDIFRELYAIRFPIHQICLVDHYGANDEASMSANNTHAFNFRRIAGSETISRHGYGMAIDINPVQNPYIRKNDILPMAGIGYLNRNNVRSGMIVHGCPAYNAFVSHGWTWGGDWDTPKDYHHFEKH